ncbi:bifunctional (p)ppGpp synthetase/guanosine-3',5'-bis(diphosphate) 3'-pyrophosphohydrolase [Marinihelvus fidelis]|uniref:GTP pyrophosphokinase n=1 Tax=Marinihelvus fidelis TaxID=2613842 RepID=A0A5N0THV2_9GAMM|nr:bifunctional (p)ppGpp synthetase/guanosine-3',5'-bis(diphosphate) 3'-pyrophosphohydrolase [Marinihelvus fidelis]KAA9133436.1 bifunctional (p)ppGpp synthetase/guanosine-3',5'-bis(diphosphate) 3'-pyrophosphohydrolase [Marinihelvus fidelis]
MTAVADTRARVRDWLDRYHREAGMPADDALSLFDGLAGQGLKGAAALEELEPLLHELAGLAADPRTLCSAMLFIAGRHGEDMARWQGQLPEGVQQQLDSLSRLHQVQSETAVGSTGRSAEGLRRLLLALVVDVRVVLIALAWQLVQLRTAKDDPERAAELGRETMLIHAPLANRLGVWQLKWELEDLAFRFQEPEAYKRVAKQVAERRADRERFIATFIDRLQAVITEAGIKGEVVGRPKHIYSIWKKMQRKGLDFHELFDLRAVRVLVDDLPACYSVLGLVHTHWQPIPGEFDDYITTPKGNNYQSLHTAVVGPEGKAVEVQIRTHDMNEHAELGVAAHWRYKEGGPSDPAFERKVTAMRQLLDGDDGALDDESLLEGFRSLTTEDRVYVLTPRGEVIDMAQGSTVLDFAYHVHTEVGHRCRGAKVNGRIVPLTHQVSNGDRVEILTAKEARPSRDWLNPRMGYINGARARSKVRQWYKKESHEENLAQGRELVEGDLKRMGLAVADLAEVPERFGLKSLDDLYAAVGNGDLTVAQVTSAAERQRTVDVETTAEDLLSKPSKRARTSARAGGEGGIVIEGVGNLMTTIARCCQPLPGDSVVGYITRSRGVTIHRDDCANVLRWQAQEPHRLLQVRWGQKSDHRYRADILVRAYHRRELFRDISAVMSSAEATVMDIDGHRDRDSDMSEIRMQVDVRGYEQLSELLSRLSGVRNVIEARRLREPPAARKDPG